MAQLVEGLPNMYEALGSVPRTTYPGVVAYVCNLSIWEAAGGPGIQGQTRFA